MALCSAILYSGISHHEEIIPGEIMIWYNNSYETVTCWLDFLKHAPFYDRKNSFCKI